MAQGPAVEVEGLGKKYLLGEREPYKSARASLARLPRRFRAGPLASSRRVELWALKDVDFALQHGEVLGVIGQNGAGKSTLLKVLSRVTSPSTGRAVMRGRASALLEVGTGFHPELTGRENVLLNGSVLGMKQADIRRKFDDIVEFAGVAPFIDTPIKRYSSGMQVRLAFAVAAFLEPDILIVDEVLAVGDVAFQRKCLGKLGDAARQGRTVLFVSHNLPAVRSLCTRAILLQDGMVSFDGLTDCAVDRYLATKVGLTSSLDLTRAERPRLELGGRIRLRNAKLVGASDGGQVGVGAPLSVLIELEVLGKVYNPVIVFNILSIEDVLIAQSVSTHSYPPVAELAPGRYVVEAKMESAILQPGRYSLGFGARSSTGLEDQVASGGLVEFIESQHLEFPWYGGPGGYLRLPVEWSPLVPTP